MRISKKKIRVSFLIILILSILLNINIDISSKYLFQVGNKAYASSSTVDNQLASIGGSEQKIIRLSNGWLITCTCFNYHDNRGYTIYLYKSTDNGLTWSQLCYIGEAPTFNPFGYPSIASNGTTIYVVSLCMSSYSYCGFWKFDATTVSNTNILDKAIIIDNNTTDVEHTSIAVDSVGTIHVAYDSKTSYLSSGLNIKYSKSTNGGDTWSTPEQITSFRKLGLNIQQPCILLKQDIPHILFYYCDISQGFNDNRIMEATKEYTGGYYGIQNFNTNWGISCVGDSVPFTLYRPCNIVKKHGSNIGRIWSAWCGYSYTYQNTTHIFLKYSDDGGVNWYPSGQPIDLGAGAPTISEANSGDIYVFYSDSGRNLYRQKCPNGTTTFGERTTIGTGFDISAMRYEDGYEKGSIIGYISIDKMGQSIQFDKLILNQAPNINITSPTVNNIYSSATGCNSISLSGTINDPDSGNIETIYYRIDGSTGQAGSQYGSAIIANGSNQPFSGSINVSSQTEETHTLYVWVQDNFGGKSSETAIPFRIDKTAPIGSPPTYTGIGTTQITVIPTNVSDPVSNSISSGVNSYLFNRNGIDIATWQSGNFTDSGLSPNTLYTYKYKVRDNVMNTSLYSGSSSVYTLAQIPILANNGTSSSSINLSTSDNNPAGTKYEIYTVDANGNPKNYVTSTGTLSTTAQWISLTNKAISITGLSPNTTYTFKAKAMNGDGIVTSESSPISATTKLSAPGSITYTYAVPSNLRISWSAVQGASSYSISTDGGATWSPTINTYYFPSGIEPGKQYTYQVSAVNGSVYSDSSTITIITPLATPDVTATATNASITLYWDAITNATGYDVTVGDITKSTTGTSITISGLEPNKTYTYSVRAKNDVATGAWSNPQNKMTRLTIPGVPQNIQATPSSNSINITWDAVDGATTYEVNADGKTISVGAATSYNDTVLEPGIQHTYQVRAINNGGKSAWSSQITANTTLLDPGVPTNFKASTSNNDITLTWDSVDKATGYEIEIDNPDQSVTDSSYIHSVTGTTYTQTGLASVSTHTYRIRSVIDGVQGPWSSAVSITTGSNPQETPQNISSTISDTSATLMWDSVSGATSYDIEENGVISGHVKGSVSFKAIGLTPNTSYSYRIRAVNSAGKGDWSDPVTITTLSEPAIDVPGNIKAIPTSNSINLIWNPVDKATGYEIEIDGNTVKTVTNNMFTYADLDPETTYKFRVRAVNQGVPVDWSGEISTTTLSASEGTQTNDYLTANYTVNAVQGQDVTILLTATDLQDLNTSKFIVTYDPDVLELSDLNATTSDTELSAGNIPDTDINITELAPGTIQFTLNTPIEKGESFSGLVDSIKFVAKKDGQSVVTYSITNTGNAYLKSLNSSSGKLSPEFTDTTLAYNLKVGSDVTSITFTPTAENPEAVIKVNGVEVTTGQASAPIDLKVGDNVVTVEVTATDGTVNKYTITVTREGGAYLTGLDLSSGTLDPVFSQTQDTYKVKVDNDVTSITLTPTAEADSVIKVNEVEVTRGQASAPIDLKTGDNTITVEVSLADGKVNIYTITVTKEGRAYLTGLDLSAGTLNPVFKSAQNTYNLSVGNDVSNITLTPVIDQSDAVIKVNGVEVTNGQASDPINLQVGDNTITVEVTAADGTVNTYTLTVIKEGGGNITGLNLSTGTLNPVFDSVQNTYSLSVGNDVTCMTLTPTAEPDSVIKVNGVEVISGQASAPIDLNVGDNAITIEVSNSDGAVNTYTITVTRESGAYLTGVDLSNGTLDPVFSEKQITYSANVGNDVTSITVSPTAKYTNAVIKVNGVDVTSEQASDPIDLQEGNNVITVEVTAADGTSSTYTITVIRAVNTDNESSIQIESIN